jgi:uncharacterized protein YceK
MMNLTGPRYSLPPDRAPMKPYGGVREDATWGAQNLVHSFTAQEVVTAAPSEFALGAGTLLIDLPLSVVGDTLTLPYVLLVQAEAEAEKRRPTAAELLLRRQQEEEVRSLKGSGPSSPPAP